MLPIKFINGELYLDGIFNFFIEQGLTVREIPLDGYINWGDPDSLKESLYWQELFFARKVQPRAPFPGC